MVSYCSLICISLITNNAKHLFMGVFANHILSLGHLSLNHFLILIRIFAFLLIEFWEFFIILDTTSLSDKLFANISSWAMFSFNYLNSDVWREEVLNCDVQCMILSFYNYALDVALNKSLPNTSLQRFSPMLSPRSFIE